MFLGLHWIDLLIVLVYLVGTLVIGHHLSKRMKGQTDFYLAGRKLGKAFQFFLNFGQMTDSSGATSTASVVYKQGVGGVWIGLQTLFMTPYYWFMNMWFRRSRLITVADLFEDRFGGKFLSVAYATFTLFLAVLAIGWGNLVACKTLQPIMVKSASAYTPTEQKMVADYGEYIQLSTLNKTSRLTSGQSTRYEMLKSLYDKGRLQSYVSYLNPLVFYLVSGAIVAIYIIMGGLSAAAIIDALQAVLTITFSIILIPFGLMRLGGFSGLHAKVPDYMFAMFGTQAASEYTWYSILAILFTSTIQIHAVHCNMSTGGSAKDELAARFGAVSGGFGKRFVIIAWTLCALIAIGLYGQSISDPDTTWGVLTRDLLPVGAIGVMLAGILAGKMASLGAQAISLSALFVRNVYMHIIADKTEGHYVFVGRITIAVLLALGVLVATTITGVISLLKVIITIGVTFGAPILLIFFWKRLTKAAVIAEVIACVVFIVVIPWIVPAFDSLVTNSLLTEQTIEQTSNVQVRANQLDIDNGIATKKSELITRTYKIEPVSLFFESVAHKDPHDLNSPLEGIGRFNIEVFMAYLLGINVKEMTPAGLMTVRFLVDGIFPYVILFVVSYFTKQTDKTRTDRFYVKLKTPIAANLELDALEIQKSYEQPDRFDHLKLFPKSNWEMCKWDKQDTVGFALCWVMVGFILAVFWLVLNAGKTILV